MTEGEILELFIRAATVDHRLPDTHRPARLKAQSLPFVHTHEERAGWEPADYRMGSVITRKDHLGNDVPITEAQRRLLKRQANDRLEYGDAGRLAIQADNFWNGDRITPAQVTELEYALELIRSVRRERNRRCLWAYAKSKAKVLYHGKKISFSRWCVDVEGIHRNHGRTCADHAISEIASKVFGKALFTNEKGGKRTLQEGPISRHLSVILDDDANDSSPRFTTDGWVVQDVNKALRRFDQELIHVPVSDLRNARRRQREAKRKQAA